MSNDKEKKQGTPPPETKPTNVVKEGKLNANTLPTFQNPPPPPPKEKK